MYKYDIPYPNKEQYALLYNGAPINVSKNVSYLKAKMKAHRDSMPEKTKGTYTITAPGGGVIFTRVFEEGEEGDSTCS